MAILNLTNPDDVTLNYQKGSPMNAEQSLSGLNGTPATSGFNKTPTLGISSPGVSSPSTNADTALSPGQYKEAPPLPTSVVSSSPAISQLNQAKTITENAQTQFPYNTVDGSLTAFGKANGYPDVNAKNATTNTTTTTNTVNSPTTGGPVNPFPGWTGNGLNPSISGDNTESSILNTPEVGNQFFYDQQGNKIEAPIGSTPPAGYSSTAPNTLGKGVIDVATTSSGSQVRKMGDGSYQLYGVDGNLIGPTSADQYFAIKSGQQALTAFNNFMAGGGTTLNAAQLSQLDSVRQQYAALISKQEVENANATGGQTIAQNMYGMGSTTIGHGAVTEVINDGIQKIADLTSKMNSAIATMTTGFEKDNLAVVKAGFDAYNTTSDNIQQAINVFQSNVEKTTAKIAADLASVNDSFAKKYPDTTTPILSTDTAATRQEKLLTSPAYQQDQKTKQGKVDQDVLDGMLTIYRKTGTIPAGMGNASVELKKAFYAAIGNAPSLADEATKNRAALTAATKSLTTQETQYNATQTSVGAMKPALDLVLSDAKTLGKTGAPIINEYLQWLQGKVAGNSDIAALNTAILTASNEYAKITSGASASIAGVTVSSADDVKSILNAAMANGQLESVVDTMKKDSNYRLTSYEGTIKQINQDISDMGSPTSSSNSSSSSSSTTGGFATSW